NYTANNTILTTEMLSYPTEGTIRFNVLIDSGVKCPVQFEYIKNYGTFFEFDSLTAVGDIIPAGNQQMDGSYTEFLIPVVLRNGGLPLYGSLRGSPGCVGIMICETCMDTVYTGGDAFCKDFYAGYLEEYASYVKAQALLLHCEGFEPLMPVLSYEE